MSDHTEAQLRQEIAQLRQRVARLEQAAASARSTEALLRSIVDNSAALIYVIDTDGRFLLVNRKLQELFNLPAERLLGQTRSVALPAVIAEQHRRNDLDVMRAGQTAVFEEKNEEADGLHYYWTTKFPLRNEADQIYAVGGISIDITERKQAQQQVEESRAQLRALAAHLESVREEERRGIAREMHDELGQTLTSIKIDVAWLARHLPPVAKPQSDKVAGLLDLIDAAITQMRGLIAQMRPGLLDDLGLVAALDWLAQDFQYRTGIVCDTQLPADDVPLAPDRAVALFRICQEALTNVTRHAQATRARLELVVSADQLTLKVSDNGRGIRPAEAASPEAFGLLGMRERALMLGGAMTIGAGHDGGTCVSVAMPLASDSPGGAAPC